MYIFFSFYSSLRSSQYFVSLFTFNIYLKVCWQYNVYFAYFNCINCHCAALEPLWRELVVRLSHKCHFGLGLCCIFILILKNIIQDSVFPMLNWICCFISLPPPHTPYCRRRIELEDMAKVVASDCRAI